MEKFDAIVCGAGPAGVAAALKIASNGKKTLCVEAGEIGGTCLNRGCIPTKAFIASADAYLSAREAGKFGVEFEGVNFDWRQVCQHSQQTVEKLRKGLDFLFRKNGIRIERGRAKILEEGKVEVVYSDAKSEVFCAEKILVACGTSPRRFDFLPVSERILDSSAALNLAECPRSAIIVGAGAIGVEFAHIWNAFGARVELVEMAGEILPLEDPEGSRMLARSFKRRGINIRTSARLVSTEVFGDAVRATLAEGGVLGKNTCVEADYMLVCSGVIPQSRDIFAEGFLPDLDDKGFIKVDQNFKTSLAGVYAAGDIIGAPLLAHAAEREGELAAESMLYQAGAGFAAESRDFIVPACAYCRPQVASVGMSEKEAAGRFGSDVKITKSFFIANGKAAASGATDGFAKLVWLSRDGAEKLVGAQIVGDDASEIISECLLAINLGADRKQFAAAVRPHPTLSEILSAASK